MPLSLIVDARLDGDLDSVAMASASVWHQSLKAVLAQFTDAQSIFAAVGGATVFSIRPDKVKILEPRALKSGSHSQHLEPVACDIDMDLLLPKALKGVFKYAKKTPNVPCSVLFVCYGRVPVICPALQQSLRSLESLGKCYLTFLIFDDEMTAYGPTLEFKRHLNAMSLAVPITVRASFSGRIDMFDVFVEEGVAPLMPQTPVLLAFGTFETWTVATPTVGAVSLFRDDDSSSSSSSGGIKLCVVRRVLLSTIPPHFLLPPAMRINSVMSTPISRNAFAENEILIGKFKAVTECLANETCALILERSFDSSLNKNSCDQHGATQDQFVLVNSGASTVNSSPSACLWKLRSFLELAPEPKFGSNMIISAASQAAWQESRQMLPLAEFPTEIFDPPRTRLLNNDHKGQQGHQQKDALESASSQIYIDQDEAQKKKKTRKKKKKKIQKNAQDQERRPFKPNR